MGRTITSQACVHVALHRPGRCLREAILDTSRRVRRLPAFGRFHSVARPSKYPEDSRLRPRTLPCSVSQSRRLWEAPAPSQRTSSFLRCAAGT